MPGASLRFTIQEATSILKNALSVLGNDYKNELTALLDPANGRIDLHGDSNRIPIRGAASVYPVWPSIFYAYNYEGYLIDLTLLGHEAGHAVQAALMYKNKTPLMYANGPAYFTESFGKFNEMLLFDYLSTSEKNIDKKKVYASQLKERIEVLFGSTEEAYVEYMLISGITNGSIKTTDDLDSLTQQAGAAIFPELYKEEPERKGLWMVLETNFRDPLHNVDDMIAAALAIKYYQLYKINRQTFLPKYLQLLKEGYHDSPANLLKKLSIDIQQDDFINSVVNMAVGE
jgi:oligoendopeptidase F